MNMGPKDSLLQTKGGQAALNTRKHPAMNGRQKATQTRDTVRLKPAETSTEYNSSEQQLSHTPSDPRKKESGTNHYTTLAPHPLAPLPLATELRYLLSLVPMGLAIGQQHLKRRPTMQHNTECGHWPCPISGPAGACTRELSSVMNPYNATCQHRCYLKLHQPLHEARFLVYCASSACYGVAISTIFGPHTNEHHRHRSHTTAMAGLGLIM
jgi:hypothetical protein